SSTLEYHSDDGAALTVSQRYWFSHCARQFATMTSIRRPVKPLQTPNLLSEATAAVSQDLRCNLTSIFKALLKIRYEFWVERYASIEWQKMHDLLSSSCDTYVSIAMANRARIRGNPLIWVTARIDADLAAIRELHFLEDCDGFLRLPTDTGCNSSP